MKTIDTLNEQLNATYKTAQEIEAKIQAEYNEIFDDLASINDMVDKIEQSTSYYWDECGDIERSELVDLNPFKDCAKYFAEYMTETHGVRVDFKNGTISLSQFGGITINDKRGHGYGDVYDLGTGKFIIKARDYTNEETGELDENLRNELIEAYMEKRGEYPGVFLSDYHGNLTLIDTSKKA